MFGEAEHRKSGYPQLCCMHKYITCYLCQLTVIIDGKQWWVYAIVQVLSPESILLRGSLPFLTLASLICLAKSSSMQALSSR